MTVTGSDRAAFVACASSATRTRSSRTRAPYFRDCDVAGHVDFIFGAGRAVFDDCTIVSRDRGSTHEQRLRHRAEHAGCGPVRLPRSSTAGS